MVLDTLRTIKMVYFKLREIKKLTIFLEILKLNLKKLTYLLFFKNNLPPPALCPKSTTESSLYSSLAFHA